MKQFASKKLFYAVLVNAFLLCFLMPVVSPAQSNGAQATLDQINAVHALADWTDDLVDRLQDRGKSVSGTSTRELQAIQGQLVRFDRIARSSDDERTAVARREVEDLLDRLARVWLDVRQSAPGSEFEGSAAPVMNAPGTLTNISRGTNLTVQLTTWLSSKHVSVGDRFSVLVAAPVYADGRIAIPEGAVLEGLVTSVDRAGRASDAGNLHLYIDRLRGPQGQIVDVHGLVVGLATGDDIKGKSVSAGKTAAGAAVGGLLGGLIDGKKGALIGLGVGAGGTLLAEKGKDVDLPQGSLLRVEVQDSFSFSWSWSS